MFDDYMLQIALFLIVGTILILCISRAFHDPKNDDEIDYIIDDVGGISGIKSVHVFPSDIVNVPGHSFLFYNVFDYYVYIVSTKNGIDCLDKFVSNNHFCKYLHGKIVEVKNNHAIAIVHADALPD